MGASGVSRDLVLEQLEKVLTSSLFQGAVRSRALLKFIVQEFLNGRMDRLKEYTIGAERRLTAAIHLTRARIPSSDRKRQDFAAVWSAIMRRRVGLTR